MSLSPFIAHLERWKGGEVFLLLVDHEGVQWLMSQFERIAKASIESMLVQFVLGDDHPVESDGRCLVFVELNQNSNDSQMARISPGAWRWSVSRSAADKFRSLLSGLLVPGAGHQYLDPDNDEGPTVEVSRGEYEIDRVKGWAARP